MTKRRRRWKPKVHVARSCNDQHSGLHALHTRAWEQNYKDATKDIRTCVNVNRSARRSRRTTKTRRRVTQNHNANVMLMCLQQRPRSITIVHEDNKLWSIHLWKYHEGEIGSEYRIPISPTSVDRTTFVPNQQKWTSLCMTPCKFMHKKSMWASDNHVVVKYTS